MNVSSSNERMALHLISQYNILRSMQSQQPTPPRDRSVELAVERTRIAYERTMMAWIRTAASLITFGFTIYKFFQIEVGEPKQKYLIGPREFAGILVCLGLVSLMLAAIEQRQNLRTLAAEYGVRRRSLAGVLAILISILGVLVLLAVIFRE